jgi:DNA replication and repair protein RecF
LTARLLFQRFSIRSLRNLTAVDFEAAPRLNVIAGDNGQGKTSLLEAIYLLATSRSFRTERIRELIQEGAEFAASRGVIQESSTTREQSAVLTASGRRLQVDGNPPRTVSAYATGTPVVVFHPGDLLLVSGSAAGRRTLLDRVALFAEPTNGEDRRRYLRALKERQKILEERGPSAADLDAFERLAATHGARLTAAHERAAESLVAALHQGFSRMAPGSTELEAHYVPAGSADAGEAAEHLRESRVADLRRRHATFGPHRDDLELCIDGRTARQHASQGQQRILTLALKMAELDCVRASRDAHPVLLLDDVSSELDPARTGAVYDFIRESPSQVFVTTTRPELFTTAEIGPHERTDWVVAAGTLKSAPK